MNRIVIVGNGFDLAHGLKTRYEDFLVKLLVDKIIEASNNHKGFTSEVENLFHVKINADYGINYDRLIESSSIENLKHLDVSFNSKRKYLGSVEPKISVKSDYDFFNGLIQEKNWSDIEGYYFKLLTDYLRKFNTEGQIKGKRNSLSNWDEFQMNVLKLNLSFETIKEEFKRYISEIEKKPRINRSILSLLGEEILNIENGKILIINFNYTNTLIEILKHVSIENSDLEINEIAIHGNIEELDDIIFGYGDDSDEQYKKLLQLGENNFMQHFKIHHYLKKANYKSIKKFLKDDSYEIFTIGHSLNLSDKYILQLLFADENCKKISICHTGGNSHQLKAIAISRFVENSRVLQEIIEVESPSLKFDRIPE